MPDDDYPAWPGPVWRMLNYVIHENQDDFQKDTHVILSRLTAHDNAAGICKALPHLFLAICKEEKRIRKKRSA